MRQKARSRDEKGETGETGETREKGEKGEIGVAEKGGDVLSLPRRDTRRDTSARRLLPLSATTLSFFLILFPLDFLRTRAVNRFTASPFDLMFNGLTAGTCTILFEYR